MKSVSAGKDIEERITYSVGPHQSTLDDLPCDYLAAQKNKTEYSRQLEPRHLLPIVSDAWNPVTDKFGAAAAIYGTVVTSLIAMLIAVPVGLFIALFLTELCPMWLRRPIGIAIELLAGIPSIIYGIWGLFVFAPFLQRTLQPFLIDLFGPIPFLSDVFAGPPYGIGILTAGLILAIMVLPFVTSISRDRRPLLVTQIRRTSPSSSPETRTSMVVASEPLRCENSARSSPGRLATT